MRRNRLNILDKIGLRTGIRLGICTAVLTAAVGIGMFSVQAEAASDLSYFSNTLAGLEIYGDTTNSYLEKTDEGWQAVLVDDAIHVIEYDSSWNQVSEKTLEYELPIFGAYYAGENYNYLVFGQSGSSEGTEIYRVVKYDKTFNRLAALSVKYEECYTSVPFQFGNVSVDENGNQMVVYTSRLRPDGHQSNIALRINTDTMTISETRGMIPFPDIHVSHSFRQIVKYDGDTPIYADLGDGYPRAVCLQKRPGVQSIMLEVSGQIGHNETDTDLSGLAVTDTGYIVVGYQIRQDCQNIYMSYIPKGDSDAEAEVTWLTGSTYYNYSDVYNAKIAQVSDGKYAVMWNNHDSGGGVDYVMVNDQAEILSGVKTMKGAELTQCEPVLSEGKLTWLRYKNGEKEVFTLSDFSCTGEFELEDPYVSPTDPWDGSADTGWYSGSAEEFVLNTPEQLAGLAQLVNEGNTFEGKKIRLGKDMFFNEKDSSSNHWTPIASNSSGESFEGTFDGQGYTLYNLYVPDEYEGGLFGTIGENGTVKAVNVSQGIFYSNGAIAEQNDGKLLFCENSSYVIGVDEMSGGVCGRSDGLVYGCSNTGYVLWGSGVVGTNGPKATVDSCWNQGYAASTGYAAAGVVMENYGWVINCYNAGTVSGTISVHKAKTVGGVVGENQIGGYQIKNCYNIGWLDIDEENNWYMPGAVCGGNAPGDTNSYTADTPYNRGAQILSWDDFRTEEMISRLQNGSPYMKWCLDEDSLNGGNVILVAQQDKADGVYKVTLDVRGAESEAAGSLGEGAFQLDVMDHAYFGLEEIRPVYSADSDVLTVTADGTVTPKKAGTAVIHVEFAETENIKASGFDVTVTIEGGMKGDVDGSGKVDIADLRMVLRKVCGKIQFTEAQESAADVEADGKVDIADLRKILRFVCGKIETL